MKADESFSECEIAGVTAEYLQNLKPNKLLIKGLFNSMQTTVIAAPFDAGKTAIFFHYVAPKLAKDYDVTYIDCSWDSSHYPRMAKVIKKHGFKWIMPFYQPDIDGVLQLLAKRSKIWKDRSKEVYIIDSLRKMVNISSKNSIKDFLNVLRGLTCMGATFAVLAHTNKNLSNGELIYEGPNDVHTECDALVYLYSHLKGKKLIVSTYPETEKGPLGQATFKININSQKGKFVEVLDKFIDVKRLNRA